MAIPLCFHLHFYQPSRVDPFLGTIPVEFGSEPFNNFNEKINAECYFPNAQLGNIQKVSFNLGPTLADWMELHAPGTYEQYLAADATVVKSFGTGNAIAQGYNHVILPHLDDFDKSVQIYWGISDFICRFGREPLGFWLPETAVDMPTMRLLVKYGIRYIFLAPWQIKDTADRDVPHRISVDNVDLVVFPYNDSLTRLMIKYKKRFSESAFTEYAIGSHLDYAYLTNQSIKALTIVSDGEFFGHHMKGREKLLHRVLSSYESVYPFYYLEKQAKLPQAQLQNNTSWTCFNGLHRWKGKCDFPRTKCVYKNECYVHDNSWTEQLWTVMDSVKQDVYGLYRRTVSWWVEEPDVLILEYIYFKKGKLSFLDYCLKAGMKSGCIIDKPKLLILLEAIYYCQLMYTSCGFFFEDIDRLEPKNNIKYLKKAISLVKSDMSENYEAGVLSRLATINSGRAKDKTAASFY